MIPRVARSGQSFHGAGLYYLNDKKENGDRISNEANRAFEGIGDYALHDKDNRQTAHRVGFTAILNMEADTPEQAIAQMGASYERYREKEAHKRGRKLTKPVYVYSLSWAPDQSPGQDEMMAAALSSLKALRLEDLQTLIVQHTDEPHPHIHVIVNRIERDGSRARNIAFDQLRFSRWAEEYEREHGGIRCEQRVRNNELRRQGIMAKDTVSLSRTEYEAREREQQPAIQEWQKEKDAFRKEAHRYQRAALWEKHAQERSVLEVATRERIENDRAAAKQRFKPQWRELYAVQSARSAELAQANRIGILERAVFVFRHKEFLKTAGPLRIREVARFCLSGKSLRNRVESAHRIERAGLAKWERTLTSGAVKVAWREHHEKFSMMRRRQELERDSLVFLQQAEQQRLHQAQPDRTMPSPTPEPVHEPEPSPVRAPELKPGESLAPDDAAQFFKDAPPACESFKKAVSPPAQSDPADDLVRRMKEYKRRRPGRDFGLER